MPESMEECIYFTKRTVGEEGKATAWVFKEKCPECGKGLMGKPRDKGKVKLRAKEYVCPECDYTVEKDEYEETLTANIIYTCPHCGFEGETQIPFKRKRIQLVNEETGKKKAADALRFSCEKCKENIDVTKKMKS